MNENGYGLWALVIFNSLLFIVFAASFFHPKSKRDWRALGGFSAFVVALFTEMYGYPLTVYLLTGPLAGLVPGVNLSHNAGHLWTDLIGWKGDPHLSPFHLASYAFIVGGFWLIAAAWKVLYASQKQSALATSGPYARIRHPQYLGLILIMVGFLLQWPTLATLVMFPVLLVIYRRLALHEENDVRDDFGPAWDAYAAATPRFVPRPRRPAPPDRWLVRTTRSVVTPRGYTGLRRFGPSERGRQSRRERRRDTQAVPRARAQARSRRGVVVSAIALPGRSFAARAWSGIAAAWGVFIGLLPHVLHHVGPLAGAALLAGAGGTAIFAAVALAVSIPFLLRIYRRFRSWVAPAIALAVIAVAFSLSSFVIGPAISGGESSNPAPGIEQSTGHDSHHK